MRWERLLLISALLPSACTGRGASSSVSSGQDDRSSIRGFSATPFQSGSDEALVRARAVRGDAQAQNDLASRYFYGQGLPQNDAQAVQWFKRAAEQGHAAAQTFVAMMYREGRGVSLDYAQAALWARKSAEQGHVRGQGLLGIMLFDGQGLPKDAVEGYKWEALAASRASEQDMKSFSANALAIMANALSKEEIAKGEALASEWASARQRMEDNVREVAVRLFCSEQGGGPFFLEVEGGPPSATLLERLRGGLSFRPVAAVKDSKQDPLGQPISGSVIKVGALEWQSDSKVLLSISTYKGPLDAFAEQIVVERHGSGPWAASVVPDTVVIS